MQQHRKQVRRFSTVIRPIHNTNSLSHGGAGVPARSHRGGRWRKLSPNRPFGIIPPKYARARGKERPLAMANGPAFSMHDAAVLEPSFDGACW